jgi:hypothetical protein
MFRNSFRLTSALAAMLAVIPAASAHETKMRGRLAFTDHEKAVLRLLDLDSGLVTHQFDMPRPSPGLHGTKGGRFIVINTGDEAGTIRFLDTGLIHESHGDHHDLTKSEVRLLDHRVTGERPAHVVSGHGKLALFYDGRRPWEGRSESKAVLLSLKSLDATALNADVWQSPGPQHGIAAPMGKGRWLVSLPNESYVKGDDRSASSRPNGFEILARGSSWTRVAFLNDAGDPSASCKLFHGHGAIGDRHVFACAEGAGGGILQITTRKDGAVEARKIAYPDERRISSITSRDDARIMVGNYGLKSPYDALIRIDPEAKSLMKEDVLPVPNGQPACRFELSGVGSRLVNLTPDGQLRVYDTLPAWAQVAAFAAVPPFDCQFDARTPAPSLAIVGKSAFVSDPMNGRIREYHLDTLKQGLDISVGGLPTKLSGGGTPPID